MKKLMKNGAWCRVPGAGCMVPGVLCLMLALCGCTATKIKYEANAQGETSYSIWHNGHWLKTEAERLSGGMSKDGRFEIGLQGYKSSPSEEFNRTMQTYMGTFIQLAQIAAAAYNPSASAALQSAAPAAATAAPAPAAASDASATNAAECADCVVGGSGAQSPSVAR